MAAAELAVGREDGVRPGDIVGALTGEAGLKVEVTGREKHPYSIWRKMAERHVSFEQVTDIMAFRVVTENEADCYRALGVLHADEVKDTPGAAAEKINFKDFRHAVTGAAAARVREGSRDRPAAPLRPRHGRRPRGRRGARPATCGQRGRPRRPAAG